MNFIPKPTSVVIFNVGLKNCKTQMVFTDLLSHFVRTVFILLVIHGTLLLLSPGIQEHFKDLKVGKQYTEDAEYEPYLHTSHIGFILPPFLVFNFIHKMNLK